MPVPWWVAGGIAIDLFVGRMVRAHGDFDVLVLREHQLIIQAYLEDWDLHKTKQPGVKPWPKGEYLDVGVNEVWCRRTPRSPWALEIMFMETEKDRWIYRRARSIGGPLAGLGRETSEGVPYVAPEIQLLFKAKEEPLRKDEQDFDAVLPLLSEQAKSWLASALETQFPNGHPWILHLRMDT